MKDIYQAAHAIPTWQEFFGLSAFCWFSASMELFYWDGMGWYEDPVRGWSATIASLAFGYMLMVLSSLFYTGGK